MQTSGPRGVEVTFEEWWAQQPVAMVPMIWCACQHLLADHDKEGRCTAGSDASGCLCNEPEPEA